MEACCAKPENLEPQETGREDLELVVCRECGRRHFELTVDPVPFGVEITPLGG